MVLTAAHIRAARALLNLTQEELAQMAGISPTTLRGFEQERSSPTLDTLLRIETALKQRGVVFFNGGQPGVRLCALDRRAEDDTSK